METSNKFQLELAIDNYLQQLQSQGNYTYDDIRELKNHLVENVDDLTQHKLTEEEAFIIAKKRLGKEEILNSEYQKVNGVVFYNRDLFVMVLSICTYLLFSYLYTISKNGLQFAAIYGGKNIPVLGIASYVLQVAIVFSFIYLVFKKEKYLVKVSKLFSKAPANFSVLSIALLVTLYFIDLNFQKMAVRHLSADVFRERYNQFTIDFEIDNLIKIVLGGTVLLSILAAFVTSYKKVKLLDSIINNSGYIALFGLGFFWDAVAANTRMLSGFYGYDFLISSVAFGLIWFIGMLIFNWHLNKNLLVRNLFFIAFGFIMELAAGIWLNPALKNGLPFSVYFIALVAGGGFGYLLAAFLKNRRGAGIKQTG